MNKVTQRPSGLTIACNLCGSVGAVVECEKCQSMSFCNTCDDMYHKHPKRRFHLRRSLLCDKTATQTRSGIDLRSIAGKIFSKSSYETKPVTLTASISGRREPAAHPSKMPIPPPRRKKKDATLQRGMIPNIMQKFGSSNFRKFQLTDNVQKNVEMQSQSRAANSMFAADVHNERLPTRASSVHQMSGASVFDEQRRSSYQSSLTGSDVSADPWSQESQFDCVPPPLPQKMRSSQTLGRRNLSMTDLYDQCQEPNVNPYYVYPQPHFMPQWMHSSLSHSIDDFGEDDDQNSISEYNTRSTVTSSSRNPSGQSTMRRAQSYMQMNPWAMQYPAYMQYPPYYPPYYPPMPPAPQFYRNQPSPSPSLRSLNLRHRREDDRASNVSISVHDSASVRSENITKQKAKKSKQKFKQGSAKSLVDMKIMKTHVNENVYNENKRASSNSIAACLSDSEEISENESDIEEEEEEEEDEKYASFSDEEADEETSSYGSLVDLSVEWSCKYCTFVNRPERDICDVCAKSHPKRMAMKKQLEEQDKDKESKTRNETKVEPKSSKNSDTNILITKEMIQEQKRVEREIRRRIENEKRIARENERIEKRQNERRKTLGSLEEREKVSEAVNAINQKTKSEEKIQHSAESATIDSTTDGTTLTQCAPKVDQLSNQEAQKEEVPKKKKVKKAGKKAKDSGEQTQGLLKDKQASLINQSEPVASANESISNVSSSQKTTAKYEKEKEAKSEKNNECRAKTETNENISITQTRDEQRNPSQTHDSQPIHYESSNEEAIKVDPIPQMATHVGSCSVPQSPQPQSQQISSQPFTPPPTCQQQVGAPNVTPVNIQSAQMSHFSSQPQVYPMQDTRRASLGALPYSQLTPSFSHPNSALDMQLNNQYITTPPQYFGSMNLIDPVVAGSMNNYSPTASPVDNYVSFAQPMLQNNFGQRYTRNDMFSMSSSLGSMKSGFEMLKVLREAEKKGFTAEDVEIAFNFSADSPMEWLETNWSNMVETVLTLANNQIMQNEKKRGVTKKAILQIPLITETEAKEALRNARGNIWQAIEKCVQRKEQERQSVNGNTTNAPKTFTLKISELGAGRDNFDENKQRNEQSVKTAKNTTKEDERLANIEEMLESWKKELIAGKKSKEQFLNTIEDLVKKKIEFIDETLARRKSSSLEEDLRRRFIEEFFSDEELDENIFVREDTINVVDGQGNVVCVKDAYKEAVNELSKEEITKKLRDKGFFIGDEKSTTIEQLTGTSASVHNEDKSQLLSADNASTTSKGKKSSTSSNHTNEQLFQASKLISEMNATLQQSLQSLHSLNTNQAKHATVGEQSSAESGTLNIVVNVSEIENKENEIQQELLSPNDIYSDAQQSVGENEDQPENESKHVVTNDSTQNSESKSNTEEKKNEKEEQRNETTVDSNKHDENTIDSKNEETVSHNKSDLENKSKDETHSDAQQNVIKEDDTQAPMTTKLTKKTYECELCAGNFRLAEMVTMPSCDHSACIECLQQYFTVQIREKQKVIIPCPYCNQPEINADDEDAVCNYLSILDQLLKVLLPEDLHELFQRKVRDRTLQKDPSFRWCSQCSSGFLACDPNAKTIACPDCKAVTCSQCKNVWQKQHIGISCEKFAEWMKANDPKFAEQYIDKHLRQFGIDCPQCKFHYELSRGGCIHFHCVQCGHDFCGFCQMPFKMGDKCNRSEWCKKLGFHAHHPRNCLFYLRDRDVNDLKRLLDMHKIKYENTNENEKCKSKKCQIMEQKWKIGEPQTGMIDTTCGKEIYCNGVCKSHYIEYLTEMIRKNKVDPVDILDEDEMVHLLRRADVKIPIKINPKQHIINLRQVIQEELPLC